MKKLVKNIRVIFTGISTSVRFRFIIIPLNMIVMSGFELLSMYVLLYVINFSQSEQTDWLSKYLQNIYSGNALFILSLSAVIVLGISAVYRIVGTKFQLKTIFRLEKEMTDIITSKYLHFDYNWHKSNGSSEVAKNVLSEIYNSTHGVLLPILNIFNQLLLALTMLVVLVSINLELTLITLGVVVFVYTLLLLSLSKINKNLGIERVENSREKYSTILEGFKGIKTLKINRLEDLYRVKVESLTEKNARLYTISQVVQLLPRFVMEFILFSGVIVLLYLSLQDLSSFNAGSITVFALAMLKTFPALQQVYSNINQVIFMKESLEVIGSSIRERSECYKDKDDKNVVTFQDNISSKDLSFFYEDKRILDSVEFSFSKGSKVGIVGPSGSGKSTFVDILAGLLRPSHGCIHVDGKNVSIHDNQYWLSQVAYVSQEVFVFSNTVLFNITLDPEGGDLVAARHAARLAQLDEFIDKELILGYKTLIGEGFISLSGGQSQRLILARALYQKPDLLILDEATSALDSETEREVVNSLMGLKDLTIITIAHRTNTLRLCDKIYQLDNHGLRQVNYEEIHA